MNATEFTPDTEQARAWVELELALEQARARSDAFLGGLVRQVITPERPRRVVRVPVEVFEDAEELLVG